MQNDKSGSMWKKTVMTYSKVLFKYFTGGRENPEGDHKKHWGHSQSLGQESRPGPLRYKEQILTI
jgi:hypothetical protein